jgi:peptidoglycan hydrolase-like protein with peptidoglycan-binding domain
VSNSKTTAIQKYLNIKADGIYGNNTIKAIIDFQNKNNLKPDGKAGDATLEKMGIQ